MRSKGQSGNVLVRIAASPLRALGKAKDMYVRSITNCGNNISYGDPLEGAGRFSRSYSVATATTSSEIGGDDYAELLRAASARTLVNRIDVDLVVKQQQRQQHGTSEGLHKSSSVGMARIDEDTPYDADGGVAIVTDPYPRSRSYAVGKSKHDFGTNAVDSRKFTTPTL
ncbi:uncharacterized protein LOC109808751 [Cajanus cajan]|uniref:Uncharacterized protein n=1 Tax=Cajanus cajan TaxID=3821 RepID=A0A151SQH8_CAJCA|nr:uncharacterized protein LOC109808751 [Cajanus cajan]KYP57096.1 hypothetical protein KK1_003351 [Cajanus cajan]